MTAPKSPRLTPRSLLGKAHIVGVGATGQGKLPGQGADDLAVAASRAALADAALDKSDIDTLIMRGRYGGAGDVRNIGHRMGIEPHSAFLVGYIGEALLLAVHLVAAGTSRAVLVAHSSDQRSNRQFFREPSFHLGGNVEALHGLASPGSTAALAFRRRMHDFGATERQLGAVAVAQSKAAAANPLAVYRDELSIDDYLAAPYVIAPLRLYDFCMVSDGGFAFIVAAEDVAPRSGPTVWFTGLGYQCSFVEMSGETGGLYHPSQVHNARRLWSSTQLLPRDIDMMYVQDAYTPNVLSALENYGLCADGTAHEWIQGGRIELDGELPVNPNGGQNRMTYMVGWQNVYDAVLQLRGTADTPRRQLPRHRTALLTFSAGHWQETCSCILSTER